MSLTDAQVGLASRSTSQPSSGSVLQSTAPRSQAKAHCPELHAVVPCAFTQARLQAPQLSMSEVRSNSSSASPSQSSSRLLHSSTLSPVLSLQTSAAPTQTTDPSGQKSLSASVSQGMP